MGGGIHTSGALMEGRRVDGAGWEGRWRGVGGGDVRTNGGRSVDPHFGGA